MLPLCQAQSNDGWSKNANGNLYRVLRGDLGGPLGREGTLEVQGPMTVSVPYDSNRTQTLVVTSEVDSNGASGDDDSGFLMHVVVQNAYGQWTWSHQRRDHKLSRTVCQNDPDDLSRKISITVSRPDISFLVHFKVSMLKISLK